jgi:hypothetical protein
VNRSGVLDKYTHQSPMTKAPPLARPDVRASEGAIRSQTGGSGPIPGSHNRHVVHHKVGDHRQGMHTGSANASKAPHITAGRPAQVFSRSGNGGSNG